MLNNIWKREREREGGGAEEQVSCLLPATASLQPTASEEAGLMAAHAAGCPAELLALRLRMGINYDFII